MRKNAPKRSSGETGRMCRVYWKYRRSETDLAVSRRDCSRVLNRAFDDSGRLTIRADGATAICSGSLGLL